MSLAVPFLGPAFFNAVLSMYRQLNTTTTSDDLVRIGDSLLPLADLAARGLDSFYVDQVTARSWRAVMIDAPVLTDLRQRQWVVEHEAGVPSDALVPYSRRAHRIGLVRVMRYLICLQRTLPTTVQHTTLREWLYRHGPSVSPADPVTAAAYRLPDEQVTHELQALIARHRDPSETWLSPILSRYKRQSFPIRRSDIVSLGRDLALLYEAQTRQAHSVVAQGRPAELALSIGERAELVASAFSQWASTHTLKLPAKREPFCLPAYWEAVLGPFGDQGVFYHGSTELWRGFPGCAKMPVNPRVVARLAYPDIVSCDRHLQGEYDAPALVPRYDYCASLKDVLDAATDPNLQAPATLICPVDSGWLTLLCVEDAQWHVRYLERRDHLRRDDGEAYDALAPSPDLFAVHALGALPLTLTSGELHQHLMRMGEQIPA
ncbi:MAG: hypothetical protein AWU57_510 [Marinobacter sp. T13-3]|nr:MAG: hypothetical protein AWU57_510 [Marinobacter sp. T13-3]